MNTPRAPQKDTGSPATIWLGDDGKTITGQETAIARADRMEANRRAAENGRDLRGEMDEAASESKMGSAPSTPTRGGTRRRRRTKYGGAQSAPRTPERPVQPIVTPSAPRRPSRTITPTNPIVPRILFPPRRPPNGQSRPSQGGGGVRCGRDYVYQSYKVYNRNTGTRITKKGCVFDPEAFAAKMRTSRKGGGKKTKRAKRSSKKTRRAHKKRRTHRKRR